MLHHLTSAQMDKLRTLVSPYAPPVLSAYCGKILLVDGDYVFYEPSEVDLAEAKEYFALKVEHLEDGNYYYASSIEETSLRLERLKELSAHEIAIDHQQRLVCIAEFLEELKSFYN
jgi:hypothetical protein